MEQIQAIWLVQNSHVTAFEANQVKNISNYEILNELFLSGESSVEHQPIMQKFIQIGMKSYLNELVEARKMRG